MIQYKTQNKSFLVAQKDLLDKYIKNNDFMLTLNNHDILDIENYNEAISSIPLNEMLLKESAENIWFYFREVLMSNLISKTLEDTYFDSSELRFKYIISPETLKFLYFYDKGYDIFIDLHSLSSTQWIRMSTCIKDVILYEYIFSFKKYRDKEPFLIGDSNLSNLQSFMSNISDEYYKSSLYFLIPELHLYEDILNRHLREISIDSKTDKFYISSLNCQKKLYDNPVFFIYLNNVYSPDAMANLLYDLKKSGGQNIIINFNNDIFQKKSSLQDVAFSLLMHKAHINDFDNKNIPEHKYIYI